MSWEAPFRLHQSTFGLRPSCASCAWIGRPVSGNNLLPVLPQTTNWLNAGNSQLDPQDQNFNQNLNIFFQTCKMLSAKGSHFVQSQNTNYFHSNDSNKPFPDSKVHGANMGSIWGRQDPDGPHVGPMNLAIWVDKKNMTSYLWTFSQATIAQSWGTHQDNAG